MAAENALRAVFAPAHAARSPGPLAPAPQLTETARRHAAGLMRVNHAGEIAAQALYHAAALFARDPPTRDFMLEAAREEGDHLAWCAQRLRELGAGPSRLAPFWYAGSFAIGAAAAAVGDRTSLGFVNETERQVEGHLAEHLDKLPPDDERSRGLLRVMKDEEAGHAKRALQSGGVELPLPVRSMMRVASQVMTRTAYVL
jgi:ubiquinone biosynthesis monooxygenase Coq7